MKFNSACYTATGTRANNEDSVFCSERKDGFLAIVADGLGGHADGELASSMAISTIRDILPDSPPNEDALIDAIRQASKEIFAAQNPQHPMHTTVTALWLGSTAGIAAHVGDSRVYQFRNGEIIYQSLDHSVAQMAVLVGELPPDELRHSRDRNRLIRVLGTSDVPLVDSQALSVQPGDRFLLCSDGFWENVLETDMLETLTYTATADDWLTSMRTIAENAANTSQDNHTAIALIVDET